MYAVSKLTKESQDFLNSPVCTGKVGYLGLAKAISNILPVPPSEPEDINDYYITNLSASVRDMIGKVNELIVIDTAFVVEAVRSLWKARAYCAFPSKASFTIFPGMCKATDVYGFGCCLTPEIETLANESAYEILQAFSGFSKIIPQINSVAE